MCLESMYYHLIKNVNKKFSCFTPNKKTKTKNKTIRVLKKKLIVIYNAIKHNLTITSYLLDVYVTTTLHLTPWHVCHDAF